MQKLIRDVKEVIRRLRNRGISFDANRQYPAIPMVDDSIESHTAALRAIREAIETHERRNPRATLDSFVRLYELEDVLGGFEPGESSVTNVYNTTNTSTVEFATNLETNAGASTSKAVNPAGGAYAYDRLRVAGQHSAGKGTQEVAIAVSSGVATLNPALSNAFYMLIDDDTTLTVSDTSLSGQVFSLVVKQDGTGGHTLTFAGNVLVVNGDVDDAIDAYTHYSGRWVAASGQWLIVGLSGFEAP